MSAVAVVGLGKLGATLAAVFADKGHQVIGVDVQQSVVDLVNAGQSPVIETGLAALYSHVGSHLSATTNMEHAVKQSSIAFIIVPTPSRESGWFSNDYVLEAVRAIGTALRGNDSRYTVVICSTVMPGSTDGIIRRTLEEASGRTVGPLLGLCYSPEFIALGSVIQDMTHPDMILMGVADSASASDLHDVLAPVPQTDPVWFRMSLVDAEIAKIGLNTYITMKISFANMMGEICERITGADARWVTAAIGADSRVGSKYIRPGGAYGGPCFPRDTEAFTAMASALNVDAQLSAAAQEINLRQAEALATRLQHIDRVTILGLAYKPNTNITERSFASTLVQLLQFQGVVVTTFDPKAREAIHGNNPVASVSEAIQASDVVVIATPWPMFADQDYTNKRVIDVWGVVPDKWNPERFGRCPS